MQLSEIAQAFAGMEDSYLAGKIDDVREASARLVRNLTRAGYQAFSGLAPGTIIIAEEITPADTALMDRARIGGFAAALGGAEGAHRNHGPLARPAGGARRCGAHGRRPLRRYRGSRRGARRARGQPPTRRPSPGSSAGGARWSDASASWRGCARSPPPSQDGVRVTLQCNIELPDELPLAQEAGAEGIGLPAQRVPLHEPRRAAERGRAVRRAQGDRGRHGRRAGDGAHTRRRLRQARLLAWRAHKPRASTRRSGLRAVRLSLRTPASCWRRRSRRSCGPGAHGPVRILVPMITSVDEIRQVRKAVDKTVRKLARARVPIADAAAARRHDRDAGCRACGGRAGRGLRLLLARHQRPHHVHARDRSRRRAGGSTSTTPCIRRCCGSSASPPTPPGGRDCRSISAASLPAIRASPPCCWASACAISPWRRPICRASNSASWRSIRPRRHVMPEELLSQSEAGRIARLIDAYPAGRLRLPAVVSLPRRC